MTDKHFPLTLIQPLPDTVLDEFGMLANECEAGQKMIEDWPRISTVDRRAWLFPHIRDCPLCSGATVQEMLYCLGTERAVVSRT